VIYSDLLADVYYDAPPVKEIRKKYKLTKMAGGKYLLQGVLKAYKEFGGKQKKPSIAIIESRPPFQPAEAARTRCWSSSSAARLYGRSGRSRTRRVSQRRLAARRAAHRHRIPRTAPAGFLVRFDLNHPIVRAYKDRAVCMVNSFRGEAITKRALFDLLTDDAFTAKFPPPSARPSRTSSRGRAWCRPPKPRTAAMSSIFPNSP